MIGCALQKHIIGCALQKHLLHPSCFLFSSLHSCAAANDDALMAAGILARIVAVMDMHATNLVVVQSAVYILVPLSANGAYRCSCLQMR